MTGWSRYRAELLPRVAILEKAALAAVEGRLGDSQREEARREAHRLAGTLGVLNLPEASRHSAELERLLAPGADSQRLSQLVWDIVEAVEEGPDGLEPPPLVLCIGDEAPGGSPGLEWIRVREPEELRSLLLERPPDALVVASDFPADDEFAVATCREMRRAHPDLPVLNLFSQAQTLSQRVRAINCGVDHFLQREVEEARLSRELLDMLDGGESSRLPSILVIEDDPVQARLIEGILKRHRLRAHLCQDEREYEKALQEHPPDLIILDLDLPHIHGLELCRRLRAHPRWRSLPILICTAHHEPEMVRSIFLAGADDYLSKTSLGVELVVRVRNRLERRQSREAPSMDPETGLVNLQVAHLLLERQLSLAHRQGVPFTLARVELHQPAEPGRLEELAQAALRSFRREDVLARCEEDCILIGLYGSSAVDAAARLKGLLEGAHPATVAVVEFPEDGKSLDSLLPRLAEVSEQAHSRGLVLHGTRLPQDDSLLAQTLDVVVVEDDALLAEIEMHSLRARGYRCRWIADGDEAARELTGDPPRLRPRLVLLDVDLPGQSGLQVLHGMKASGALRGGRTKVIVVTVRANEAEVLESLEAGAIDHLVKPFSLSSLLSRVGLALRR